jgi:hypothetical protein
VASACSPGGTGPSVGWIFDRLCFGLERPAHMVFPLARLSFGFGGLLGFSPAKFNGNLGAARPCSSATVQPIWPPALLQ